MNTAAQSTTSTLRTGSTLRERVAQQYAAQHSTAHDLARDPVLQLVAQAQLAAGMFAQPARTAHSTTAHSTQPKIVQLRTQAMQHSIQCAAVYNQARHNLSTANWIGKSNKALGKALRSLAMKDMNSTRTASTGSAAQFAVLEQYSNLGTFWG